MNKMTRSESPLIVLVDNFLTQDQLNDIGFENVPFKNSEGFMFDSGKSDLTESRTSSTYFDYRPETEFVYPIAIEFLKEYFPDVEEDQLEKMQITRYTEDQMYVPHWDYFNVPGFENTTENDRRGTLIIYLNDDFGGGTTHFPKLGIHIHPRAGSAVFFRYDYSPAENQETLHSGEPVSKGTKYIITIWIRNKKYV